MFWIKMIGVALIISGFGTWGLTGARNIGKRTAELKELRFAISFLEKEISYTHTPLSRALEKTSKMCQEPAAIIFRQTLFYLTSNRGYTVGEAWLSGIKRLEQESHLAGEDLEILRSIAYQLGMSDSGEQKKFLTLVVEELGVQEEKARVHQEANQKLWSYGGFILGTVVVLLLI